MPYVTDDAVREQFASVLLKVLGVDRLPDGYERLVARSNQRAYSFLRRKLIARGYSASQADSWDDREELNLDLAVMWCLLEDGTSAGTAKSYDRRAELDDAMFRLTVGGEAVAPGNLTLRVGRGDVATDDDTFSLDTEW